MERASDECITERTIRMNIAKEIIQERTRQITDEGYSLQHDDELDEGQLAEAGSVYASTRVGDRAENYPYGWVFKPTERRRELIKAAALIMAEIERLDRRAKDDKYYDCKKCEAWWNKEYSDKLLETDSKPMPVKCCKIDGVEQDVKEWTVKQWFQKINEELDEFKVALIRWDDDDADIAITDEAADTITVITSMLEAMGFDEN